MLKVSVLLLALCMCTPVQAAHHHRHITVQMPPFPSAAWNRLWCERLVEVGARAKPEALPICAAVGIRLPG